MTRPTSIARRSVIRLLAAAALVLGAATWSAALAGPLEDAKAAGLVGEQPDGYLGTVPANPPADVTALVRDINGKRQAAYQDIATRNNTSVEAVGQLAAQKIYNEAKPGTFLMVNGRWIKK